MSIVRVASENPYDVTIGRGVVAGLADAVAAHDRVAIVHPLQLTEQVDAWTAELPGDVIQLAVPNGEAAKDATVLAGLWEALAEAGFTRSDCVVGVGGGATTDLAGFAASTYLRGVASYGVPTTVLAMVDAAVGGKTGIDLPQGKNLVGAFWEPRAVFVDLDTLATLPVTETRGGWAEAIKHGFIADPRTLELFEADPGAAFDHTSAVTAELVERSIAIKASVVAGDLREATSSGKTVGRELLNYGHTLAHAIEKRERYTMNHGAAVAIGMNFAATLSRNLGHLDDAVVQRHRRILTSIGLPIGYVPGCFDELRATMAVDKKARGASLRFVLLDDVADPFIAVAPDEGALRATYDEICGA